MGSQLGSQEPWMQMASLSPAGSDAEILYDVAPQIDLNVDWIQIQNMPAKKVDSAKEYLKAQRGSNLDAQLQIKYFDLLTLNRKQFFAANIIQQNMDSQTLKIIMGGLGTRESIVFKSMRKIMNETVQNSTSVLRLCTTGTAAFVISGSTCHFFWVYQFIFLSTI